MRISLIINHAPLELHYKNVILIPTKYSIQEKSACWRGNSRIGMHTT